jgi:hypothetical protein
MDAMLDSLTTAAREEVDVEKRYETLIGIIRSLAEAAQTWFSLLAAESV